MDFIEKQHSHILAEGILIISRRLQRTVDYLTIYI